MSGGAFIKDGFVYVPLYEGGKPVDPATFTADVLRPEYQRKEGHMDYEAVERERAQRIADLRAEVLRRLGRAPATEPSAWSWEHMADLAFLHADRDAVIDEVVLAMRAEIRAQEATEGAG